MSKAAINEMLTRAPDIKVLVIGDIMLDKYLIGRVDRMSPEAPVPVLRHETTERKVGGAGNVALNFKALGCQTFIAGIIGNDEEGRLLSDKFEREEIVSYCYICDDRPTTVKTRLMKGSEHLLRVDFEDDSSIDEQLSLKFLSLLKSAVEKHEIDLIVIQDYNKGLMTSSVIHSVLEMARNKGVFTAVDPKFDNYWEYTGVNLFKPNLKEARTALGLSEEEGVNWEWIAMETRQRLGANCVVLTLSENGILVIDEHSAIHGQSEALTVVDVCGAGDGVLAGVSVLGYMGLGKDSLIEVGNMIGRQICLKPGVALINPEELKAG